MPRAAFALTFIVLAMLTLPSRARAGGFDVEVKVNDGKTSQSAKGKAAAESGAKPRRPSMEASVDSAFTATWKVTRTDAAEAKDVLVHFYVVKLDRSGQAPPALEPARVAIESAVTMDFAKDKATSAVQKFRIEEPGVYLVRIEVGGDPDKPGVEDFTELELTVK